MDVTKETRVSCNFSAEDVEKILVGHINNIQGMSVPEKYEITFGRDSSVDITFESKSEKKI